MNSRITEKSSLNVYEQARLKLHVANTPDCLPCREKQFSDIYNFIETNLRNHTGGCMYVCGVPGTGKTLTVRQVVLCLKESVRDAVLPAFKYIEVNAFQVTEPYQIYKLIYKVGLDLELFTFIYSLKRQSILYIEFCLFSYKTKSDLL